MNKLQQKIWIEIGGAGWGTMGVTVKIRNFDKAIIKQFEVFVRELYDDYNAVRGSRRFPFCILPSDEKESTFAHYFLDDVTKGGNRYDYFIKELQLFAKKYKIEVEIGE